MSSSLSARHACPSCGSRDLRTTITSANGNGPNLLPSLGAFLEPAQFDLHLCADCGHLSLFATEETLAKLSKRKDRWKPIW